MLNRLFLSFFSYFQKKSVVKAGLCLESGFISNMSIYECECACVCACTLSQDSTSYIIEEVSSSQI